MSMRPMSQSSEFTVDAKPLIDNNELGSSAAQKRSPKHVASDESTVSCLHDPGDGDGRDCIVRAR